METVYNLTIDETKMVAQETSAIVGCLKAIVISSDKPVHITAYLSDNPNIKLVELSNFVGDKFLTLRTPCNDYKGDIYNYQVEEYFLNDKVTIQAQGMPNSKVQFKIRWED